MPTARHTFAHLDVDSDASIAPGNSYSAGRNLHLEPGYVKAATGNVVVPYALPATGTNQRLGGFEDGATGTAVSLLYNSLGAHRLIRYDPVLGTETTLLEWSGLNLSATLIPQGGILDGLLVYLGADGMLRSIPIARVATGFYTPALLATEPFALHLVKVPPTFAPIVQFGYATTPETALRIIQTKAYQFALRWRYLDGELTVLSPFSDWLDVTEDPAITQRLSINVQLYAALTPAGVSEVEVLVRVAGSEGWAVAQAVRRTNGVLPASYDFYGITSGAALPVAEATRSFESEWPAQVAGSANGRLFKGNELAGYPTPTAPFAVTVYEAGGTSGTPIGTNTFHENASYRVALQFYDAQGKPFGCSPAVTVPIPAQNHSNPTTRLLIARLSTPAGPSQHAEIPAEADSCQFLVARNDRAVEFRQGQAADTRAFLGNERLINGDGSITEQPTLAAKTVAHEKLWVDIGNWPAAGLGYVWQSSSGDLLRFLDDRQVFPITGQYGDYVEVQWSGGPVADRPLVEIFTPNTAASATYYERGPRLRIVREAGQRRYAQTEATLIGDCFLAALSFPQLVFDSTYLPPNRKKYSPALVPVLVESMVPKYRLVSGTTRTTTTQGYTKAAEFVAAQGGGAFVASLLENQATAQKRTVLDPQGINLGATFAAQPGGPASGVWLDMGYGGRAGLAVPLALQQVRRPNLLRFSGVKVQGTLLNGLSQWEALSQYEEVPQEQGAITRLTVADQTQTDGSILLVNQERGDVSLSLGRSQIQAADGEPLLAISKQVIGGANALRGGYGCTDPAGVVNFGGKVFFPCRRRAELLRYDRNGLTPLGLTYKARTRLEAAFRQYAAARVSGCYDPRRKEYLLTFGPTAALPGLTLVYSDRMEAWADELTAVPEAGLGVGNELITWQAGALWRHAADAPLCSFFGVATPAQLTFSVAQPGGVAKQFKDVAVESGTLWLATAIALDTNLTSLTRTGWFTYREGVWRTGLRRAANSPGFPTPNHSLDNGKPLVGTRATFTLTAPADAQPLTAVAVSWVARTGQGMGA